MEIQLTRTNVEKISEVIHEASTNVAYAYAESSNDQNNYESISPEQIASALSQFVDIMHMIDHTENTPLFYTDASDEELEMWAEWEEDAEELDSNDISEIGNYALDLIQTLSDWATTLRLPQDQHQLQSVMVEISLWIARHGGNLSSIETVVDTLACIANTTYEAKALVELSNVMGELINAVSQEVRQNINVGEHNKIWHMINVNRGIVATRTHDPLIMEPVFEQLVVNIPEAAALFFEDGMQQINALDYPQHVRDVMNKYYKQHSLRVLH